MLDFLSRIANKVKSKRFDALLEKLEQRDSLVLERPDLVTVNDCILAYKMGYEAEVDNGRVIRFRKKKKRLYKR